MISVCFIFVFVIVPMSAESQEINLLVNQAGYDTLGVKRVWMKVDISLRELAEFQVVHENQVVYWSTWEREVPLWGNWYRVGDFSDLRATGEFKVRIVWQGKIVESPAFIIESNRFLKQTGPLSVRFFSIQRCGTEVPGWHAACHIDDGKMPDETSRDLTGGWHDAGDYNKYNGFTPLAVYALAKFSGNNTIQKMVWKEEFPTPLDETLWGATWLRKAQDPSTKKLIGMIFSGFGYWGPPELETDNVPGNTDDRSVLALGWNENELAAAAYAVLYANTGDISWKNASLELWAVITSQEPAGNVIQRSKRLLASVELYRITNDRKVLEDAEESARYLLSNQKDSGSWPKWSMAFVEFGLPAAALAEFVLTVPENELNSEVRDALYLYLQNWDRQRIYPFDIPKWNETEYFYPYSLDEWYVGQNGMYLSQAWSGALLARVFPQDRKKILRWTQGCLDWVTGANPFSICMMYGLGTHHLPRYHHRYETIKNGKNGRVPGAICNGITRKNPDSDLPFLDITGNTWQTNEPWLPHNAFLLLTMNQIEANKKRAKQRR